MPKIFLVTNKYQADKKVYFVDNQYAADEKVFIVSNVYQADYKAFEVTNRYEADIKVFRVQNQYQADSYKGASGKPKSSGFFGSSSSSSSSSSIENSSSSSSFSSSRSYDSDDSSGSSKSGCGKKLFTWFVMIILIGWGLQKLGFLDGADSSSKNENGKIINTKGLNLRKSAGTDGEIIKLMIQNDSIWQINDSSQVIGGNTWVYVTDKIDTGWVNETYLN